MQYINNKSDFALDISLTAMLPDGTVLATTPPQCDFELTFGTRYSEAKYTIGRYNGEARGYTVNADGSLHVVFDAHGLGLGRLGCLLLYGIPDTTYPDGVANIATPYELDVELIGWDADTKQSGTVTLATEAAAVSAAQQAQAVAEQAAAQVSSAVATANEAKATAQQAEQYAETAVSVSKDSLEQVQAAAQAAEASRQAAEQAATQAEQARQEAANAAESSFESKQQAQQSATAAEQSATQATQAAASASEAVAQANAAIAEATTAANSAIAAAGEASTAAEVANTAADNASQYVERYDDIANSLPIVADNFDGAENDKGMRYVVRKNKLIAILKNGQVQYAPEGVAFVDAIEPTSFTIGTTTYNVPQGVSYVELGITSASGDVLYGKGIYKNGQVRGFGLYLDSTAVTSLGLTFSECPDLEWLDLSGLDTSAVTYGYAIVRQNPKLTTIKGKLSFPKAQRIDSAFSANKLLTSVDIEYIGRDCKAFNSMFNGCSSLAALDVSGFDTAACTNMASMFNGCSSLAALDVSGFDTAACTNMDHMFGNLRNITELDVRNFDTSLVTSFSMMFNGSSKITYLDLSSFSVDSLTNCWYMFVSCSSLHTLKFPNIGKVKADNIYNQTLKLDSCPLDRESLDSIFSYDRTANGLTNTLTVQLSAASKALLTAEEIAAITAKGYTIA